MRKELHDVRVRFLGTLIVCLALFFTVAPFQKLSVSMLEGYEASPQARGIFEKLLPKGFVEKLKEWNFYINSQWFGKNFGQLVPIIGIIIGFPLFAREIERETIGFLLARKSRSWVFKTKVITGLVAVLTIISISSVLPSVYSVLVRKQYDHGVVFGFFVHSLFGAVFWYAVAVFFSVIFDDQVKPLLASLGVLAVTTAAGLLKPLRFLNTYAYSLGSDVFRTGGPNWAYTGSLLVIASVVIFASGLIFGRRDF